MDFSKKLKFLFSVNLYYFIEHHEARKDEEPEVENEISRAYRCHFVTFLTPF